MRELYRHMLERQPDAAAAGWVRQLENGRMTVRDVVLAIASSPEYTQRFIYPETGGRMPYKVFHATYRNNDNRLSQDQSGGRVIDRGITPLPATGPTVVVDAWERWMDTGIDVYARDLLLFQASGTIRVGDDDAWDVATPDGAPRGNRSLDVPMLTQRAGALIGRIGHSQPFFVGSDGVVVAPTIGRLYLGVNDDDYRDNTGSFAVTITVQ